MKKTVIALAVFSTLVFSASLAGADDFYRQTDRYIVRTTYGAPLVVKFIFGYGQPYYMERRYVRYDRPWYPPKKRMRREIRYLKREIRFLRRELRHDRHEWRPYKPWRERRHRW